MISIIYIICELTKVYGEVLTLKKTQTLTYLT